MQLVALGVSLTAPLAAIAPSKRWSTRPRSEIQDWPLLRSSWLAPQSAPAGHSSAATVRRGLRIPATAIDLRWRRARLRLRPQHGRHARTRSRRSLVGEPARRRALQPGWASREAVAWRGRSGAAAGTDAFGGTSRQRDWQTQERRRLRAQRPRKATATRIASYSPRLRRRRGPPPLPQGPSAVNGATSIASPNPNMSSAGRTSLR